MKVRAAYQGWEAEIWKETGFLTTSAGLRE